MPTPDDRSTYSALARARRRQGRWRDLHRRPGQTRDFLPASRDCASGKLYPRRIYRGIVSSVVPSGVEGARQNSLMVTAYASVGMTMLRFPNSFPADNRPHRAAFEFPAVEWRIART